MIRTAIITIVVLGALPSFAQTSAPATRPDLPQTLDDLDAKAATFRDLSADFQQKKFTSLTTDPLISAGTVRVSGSIARWDTQSPQPSVLYSDGKELRLYYPSQNIEEIYPIGSNLGDLLSSPLPNFHALTAHFRIEQADAAIFDTGELPSSGKLIALRLVPTDASIAQHVQEVDLAIDLDRAALAVMRTVDVDGDKTDVIFHNQKTNTGIRPADLDLKIPPGTTISHPLEGAPGAP